MKSVWLMVGEEEWLWVKGVLVVKKGGVVGIWKVGKKELMSGEIKLDEMLEKVECWKEERKMEEECMEFWRLSDEEKREKGFEKDEEGNWSKRF
jgi:hypothetical protein